MVVGKEAILKAFTQNDFPYWKIKELSGDSANFMFTSGDAPNLSISASSDQLSETLGLLGPGRYKLVCKSDPTQAKTFREFKIELVGEKQTQPQNAVIAGFTKDDADKMFAEKLEAYKNQMRLESLEKELKEKSKELSDLQNSGAHAFFSQLGPYALPVLKEIFPHVKVAAPIAGTEQKKTENDNTTTMNDQEKLTAALKKWAEADPDNYLKVIEKIAEIAANDKTKYDMYVPMLLA